MNDRNEVVGAARLTSPQQADVEALIAVCQRDGIDPEPYRDAAGLRQEEGIHSFLCYDGENLAGCFLSCPGIPRGSPLEIVGLVHPDRRRRGIGRALLEAVRAECHRRGEATLTLVCCEEAPSSGSGFATAVGGRKLCSEHRMLLNPERFPSAPPHPEALTLRRALAEEAETLVQLNARSFGHPEEHCRNAISAWLADPQQRFYIGARGEQEIGMLRVGFSDESVYLNTFGVLPEFRSRGFGRQILSGVVRDLGIGDRRILIEVETENDNALHLYRSCGFEKIATFHYYEVTI